MPTPPGARVGGAGRGAAVWAWHPEMEPGRLEELDYFLVGAAPGDFFDGAVEFALVAQVLGDGGGGPACGSAGEGEVGVSEVLEDLGEVIFGVVVDAPRVCAGDGGAVEFSDSLHVGGGCGDDVDGSFDDEFYVIGHGFG